MSNLENSILNAKDNLPNVTPTPPGIKPQSSVHDLKSRLEWGEPAFTILDVRDREAFNQGHIMGALPYPIDELVERAKSSLEPKRDIYVYSETDEETAQAAAQLREAGYFNVAELRGGLAAWKAINGPTDGVLESQAPVGKAAYNVVDQVKQHAETQQINFEKK